MRATSRSSHDAGERHAVDLDLDHGRLSFGVGRLRRERQGAALGDGTQELAVAFVVEGNGESTGHGALRMPLVKDQGLACIIDDRKGPLEIREAALLLNDAIE